MFLGLLLGFATSVAWALGNVYIQRSGRAIGGPRALTWALALGAVLSAAAAAVFDERSAPITGAVIAWLFVAAVSGVVAYAAIFYSFTRAKLSLAVPFVASWSLIAGFLSIVVFDQQVRAGQLAGAAIVFIGVVLVSIGASNETQAAPSEGVSGGMKPLLVAFLSGVGFGVMVPAMNQTTAAFGAFGTASVVYVVGLVIAVPVALLAGVDLGFPPRAAWPVVLGAGVFETLGFVCLNAAGRVAPMPVVAPVASLAAAITVVYAAIFLRERPGRLALGGALLASLGVVVLAL